MKLRRMKIRAFEVQFPCAQGKLFNRIYVQAQICQPPTSQEGYDNWLQLSLVNRVFFITFCLTSFSSKYIRPLLHIHETPVINIILV